MKKYPKNVINLLLEGADLYNCSDFIKDDPIQVPHSFSKKEDIEIAAFLTSAITWGNRTSIIKNAKRLMELMENSPFNFISEAHGKELLPLASFIHRTFNGDDCLGFINSLRIIYTEYGGLEKVFSKGYSESNNIGGALKYFRTIFMKNIELKRTGKHVSDIQKGSAAKRLNMYLRWMVRNDNKGVDFGLWKNIPSSALIIPLDVHVGNVSRKLGLLERNQNDWKAAIELTEMLKTIDPSDPVRFDFALFGMGVNKKINS